MRKESVARNLTLGNFAMTTVDEKSSWTKRNSWVALFQQKICTSALTEVAVANTASLAIFCAMLWEDHHSIYHPYLKKDF
jgi:hypothetical protein